MNRPDPDDLNEILNRCISRLQDGHGLEATLAEYPAQAARLRPILEAVLAVWSARGSDTVPLAAMQKSRRRLLQAAADIKQAKAAPWWRRSWGMMTRGALVPAFTMLLCAVLLVTGIASAQALPGQPLYPVKLAAEQISLSLPASPAGQLAREENYDMRRKGEVEELLSHQGEQEVELTGFLILGEDGSWRIDELKVSISPLILEQARKLAGRYVAVHADLLVSGEMIVEALDARVYYVSGQITRVETAQILIGDIWIQVTPETRVNGALLAGREVRISVTLLQDGRYLAVQIDVKDRPVEPSPSSSPTQTPHALPSATETETVAETQPAPEVETEVSKPQEPTDDHSGEPEATRTPEHEDDDDEDENHGSPSATAGGGGQEEGHDPSPTARPRRRATVTPTPTPTRRSGDDHEGWRTATRKADD